MDNFSYISNAHGKYLDELYKSYQQDPSSVDITWQKFFEGFEFSKLIQNEEAPISQSNFSKQSLVDHLIQIYRHRAHLKSDTNPVRQRRNHNISLSYKDWKFQEHDLEKVYDVNFGGKPSRLSLKDLIHKLDQVYLKHIGYEYMHIRDQKILDWFVEKCENEGINVMPDNSTKRRILNKLNEAVIFENFLHTKFLGQKRFSLEGGENTIPALDAIINKSSEFGVKEVVIGMAHRGRLNVLANIMGKTYEQIFSEFEGSTNPDLTYGDGDVKYHLGYSSNIVTQSSNEIYIKLTPNPSHLEAVDPVVLGYVRGQIDEEYEEDLSKSISVLIHGDAAIAGQGVVYEVVQMSQLPGYQTGGTIHFVINNQVGFTTDYDDARSSIYCTDIAKIVDAPVLHVNGDDAEAVVFVSKLAVEYNQTFGRDIFIDLLCYRRHGHNESDEPKFTQPKLYNIIAKHPNPRDMYVKSLVERGDIKHEEINVFEKEFRAQLQDRLNEVKQKPLPYKPQNVENEWKKLSKSGDNSFDESPNTAIKKENFLKVANALVKIPSSFKPLKQIEKLIKERKTNFFEKEQINWADAELLAYGSLLLEGKSVRMSGQDVKRGTFSHRHAEIMDAKTNESYCQLNHIESGQKSFKIYNSLLSEFGVLGFEYGYSMASPNTLVIWEAQFGDFANGAQVIIDQFITSAESKWQLMNGMVIFLPHGYEGQGPEHSNARPERFLQLSAEDNIVVTNITTPANLFHMLKRQLKWSFRKPCINFSPKSLLRHPAVVSPLSKITNGSFEEMIQENVSKSSQITRLLFCSGKIYFDLIEKKHNINSKNVTIVRIEQLHPFPKKQFESIINKYKKAEFVWVQEEPENMGYWTYILRTLPEVKFRLISRKASASPATGYAKIHKNEQAQIVTKAFE